MTALPTTTLPGVMRTLQSTYGPYVFGVVSLLVIWFAIVKPEFSRRDFDAAEFRRAAEINKESAVLLNATAERLDRVSQRLERNP